ncbi:phosphate/sulfate permease [Bradyrhizobium sp. AZCC 1610]
MWDVWSRHDAPMRSTRCAVHVSPGAVQRATFFLAGAHLQRIVITVGEKIGKTHLTYAQGASAELVAASTIGVADVFGLPVSTTHVLSSGVAGTMAANGSGLQMATIRNLLMAWVLTLPAAICLSASLYVLFSNLL